VLWSSHSVVTWVKAKANTKSKNSSTDETRRRTSALDSLTTER